MKYFLYIGTLLISIQCISQDKTQEAEEVFDLDYFPEQREGVDDNAFRKWTYILENSYDQIKSNDGRMVYADHLNLATAFIHLKEPKKQVLNHWKLAQEKDLESTAEVFPLVYGSYDKVDGYLTSAEYDSLIKMFNSVMDNKEEKSNDPEKYAKDNNLDIGLVNLMAYLMEKDQEFRSSDILKQQSIDQRNIEIIDSLFLIHNKYIGKSMVGDEYSSTMFLVVQHADLEHQEKYLPVIHQAVINEELNPTPLKMLIDRIYSKKYGYQIFGSQSGRDLADEATIEKVKKEYGL